MKTDELTVERLYELVRYNRATGVFTWRVSRGGPVVAGSVVGSKPNSDGYINIKLDGVLYKAHRLAWAYVTGQVVPHHVEIDHKNGVRHQNQFKNLRLADQSESACNRRLRCDNTVGYPGVHYHKQERKYRVRVMKNGTRLFVGDFESLADAISARKQAAAKLHGKFALENRP